MSRGEPLTSVRLKKKWVVSDAIFVVASLAFMFAGLLLITFPDGQEPSLSWKVHFGWAEALIGFACGLLLPIWWFRPSSSDEVAAPPTSMEIEK